MRIIYLSVVIGVFCPKNDGPLTHHTKFGNQMRSVKDP